MAGEKVIIISHFHPDHMANLQYFEDVQCYVSRNTFKYTKKGTIVDKEVLIQDGVQLRIFQLPSSHAKGSLGLEVNEEYAFVGDAIAPSIRPEGLLYDLYNVQLLAEEIRVLKKIKASIIIQSHNMGSLIPKSEIIERLESIYARRNGQNPFIEVEKKYD